MEFTPLTGCSRFGPSGYCSLLEFEGKTRVLLDCGISFSTLSQRMNVVDDDDDDDGDGDGDDDKERHKVENDIDRILRKLEEINFGGDTEYELGDLMYFTPFRFLSHITSLFQLELFRRYSLTNSWRLRSHQCSAFVI